MLKIVIAFEQSQRERKAQAELRFDDFLGLINGAAVQQYPFIDLDPDLRNLPWVNVVRPGQMVEQLDGRMLAGIHRESLHRRMVQR